MDQGLRTERGRVFGGIADVYESTRPGYPGDAVEWLLGRQPLAVLELGAGTGKLTSPLVAAGHDVVATDPSGPMLDHLAAAVDATVVRCRAERLPFASDTFDAVVVAQAFHWFHAEAAVPEIARVLRPGGHIALVWNFRDESVPWVRRLGAIIGTEDKGVNLQLSSGALGRSGLFGDLTAAEFRFWQHLDRDGLVGLVRSRSYIAAMAESGREEVLERVRDLYDQYGQDQGGLRMPYRTECYRALVLKERRDRLAPGTPLLDFR